MQVSLIHRYIVHLGDTKSGWSKFTRLISLRLHYCRSLSLSLNLHRLLFLLLNLSTQLLSY
jgi:hypothetical protein